jgi:hypothetical protein
LGTMEILRWTIPPNGRAVPAQTSGVQASGVQPGGAPKATLIPA